MLLIIIATVELFQDPFRSQQPKIFHQNSIHIIYCDIHGQALQKGRVYTSVWRWGISLIKRKLEEFMWGKNQISQLHGWQLFSHRQPGCHCLFGLGKYLLDTTQLWRESIALGEHKQKCFILNLLSQPETWLWEADSSRWSLLIWIRGCFDISAQPSLLAPSSKTSDIRRG